MEQFSLRNFSEFDNHRSVLMIEDQQLDLTAFIAIHRGGLKCPAFGATRFWNYSSNADALRDALRLSKMMSYKSAMAGLPYGGAKAVIIDHNFTDQKRTQILLEYAERLNYLGGKFITGTDVGLQLSDLEFMKTKTSSLVGLKVDPTQYTALGLIHSLSVCLQEVFGSPEVSGHSFAIEGLGKIGRAFLANIYQNAGEIYVSDLKLENLSAAKRDFPKIKIIDPAELPMQKVDIYSPCGTNGSLNSITSSQFNCKIILGGANNQLENELIGEQIHQAGILYAPDYVVNAGGLISVTHEFEDKNNDIQSLQNKVLQIKNTLQQIFSESKKLGKPPFVIANLMAKKNIANF